MIGRIKENKLKKQIEKISESSNKYLRKIEDYRKILYVSEQENESFKKTIQKYFPNAHIHHLYLRIIKTDTTIGHNYSVHDSDFNFTGKLKNDKLALLCKDHFDLIIDLSQNSLLMNYFIREINSNLVVGRMHSKNEHLHDLFIEGGANEIEFIENIMRQIKLLTKNEY